MIKSFTNYNQIKKSNLQGFLQKICKPVFILLCMLLSIVSASAQAPANDDQCNAVLLTPDVTCNFQTFTTADATGSTGVTDPGCADFQGSDVWFQVVVPAEGNLNFDTQAGDITDGGMAIYSGDCDNLTLIDCNDDNNTTFSRMPFIAATGLTPGSTVWVRFWEYGGDNNGTFGICVSIPPPPAQPPANDEPCNAIDITVGTTCNFDTYTNAGATSSNVPDPLCTLYDGGDVWFSVTVPDGGGLIFDSQSDVITDGGMAIYTGTCDALTEIDCNDDGGAGNMPKIIASGLTPGSTVWVRFWEYGGDNNGTFGLCVTVPPPPPANDEPCNGILIPVETTCNYTTYTNESATGSTGVPAPGCANYLGGDVWFQVVVPDGGALLFDTQTGTMTDGGMAIYSGACDNLTLIACNDNSSSNGLMPLISTGGLTPGSTVWVRVWESGNDNNGTFGLCVTIPPPPPANDEPCAGIPVAVNTTCTYSTYTNENATGSIGIPAPGCANYQGGDVWFSAIVPSGGALQFDTQTGTMTDGGMAIYTGTCSALTLVACDDNLSPNGAMPLITTGGLTPGSTVWIRIWENGGDNNGTFGLCVTIPPPPPVNDDPCNAIVLTAQNTCNYQTFTNVAATGTTGVPAPGCASYQGGDVWFAVVVGATGHLIFDTQIGGITDGGMAIYRGACNALTLIECNDDASVNGAMPKIDRTGLTPGDTIWVRVWEYGGDNNGTFGICVKEPPPPPAYDEPCAAIPLTVQSTCNYQTFSNESATSTTTVSAPDCANYTSTSGDVWFTAIVPAGGSVDIDTRAVSMTDGGMAIYSGTACTALTLISCDDNSSANPDMPYITATGLVPGSTIWIRVWSAAGSDGNGTFDICLTIPGPQPATFSFNCAKDTFLTCGPSHCFSLSSVIPNIHSTTSTYEVNPLSGANVVGGCFNPYVNPGGPGPSTNLTIDDRYTQVINLPFSFPFYGVNYNSLVASTNGYVSFDVTEAGQFSHYSMLDNNGILSPQTGNPLNLPSALYDRALIMGPYHDLDPAYTTSATQKIKYNVTGTAPNRRWILSFYKVPLFNTTFPLNLRCDTLINNTHQIVLYEGTGVIEVFVFDREACPTWNKGRAMIGLQNFDRTSGIMAPGRAASDSGWGGIGLNESWRFVPTGGPTLFKKVELFDFAGNLVATGDTSSINNTSLRANFDSICPTGTGTILKYIVKSTYTKFDDPNGVVISTDTIFVHRGVVQAGYVTANAKCKGSLDGSITINPTTGVPPYQYSVTGGPAVQNGNVFTVGAGTYFVSVTDSVGCGKDTVIVIAEPAAITATYVTDSVNCNGGSDGTITVVAGNATAPYLYAIGSAPYQTGGLFTVAAGSYPISIKDANGCLKDTTIIVAEPAKLAGTYVTTSVKCNGGNDGTITIAATAGTAPYLYAINGGTYQPGGVFTTVAGTIPVSIKDAYGCLKDTTIVVTQPAILSATTVAVNAGCNPTSIGQITVTAAGGTVPYGYSIDGVLFQPSNIFTPALGNYTLTVKDSNSCVTTATATISFNFDLTLKGSPDTAVCENNPVRLTTQSNALNYSWSPVTYLDNPSIASPLASPTVSTTYILTATTGPCVLKDTVTVNVAPLPTANAGADVSVVKGEDAPLAGAVTNAANFIWSPSTYLSSTNALSIVSVRPQETTSYTLTATNSVGCSVSDTVLVTVIPYCIKVKNAFTPNGDGVNDTWMVYDQSECLTNIIVNVYNRYGSKVYESRNYRNDWKGTYNGKSLPDATYYYVIDFYLTNGRKVEMRGDVTILR